MHDVDDDSVSFAISKFIFHIFKGNTERINKRRDKMCDKICLERFSFEMKKRVGERASVFTCDSKYMYDCFGSLCLGLAQSEGLEEASA